MFSDVSVHVLLIKQMLIRTLTAFQKLKKRYSLLIRGTTNYVSSKHNVASLREKFSMSQMRVDYWMEIDVFE